MKEKLIELLKQVKFCPFDDEALETCEDCKWKNDGDCDSGRTADHLIANGVTVQKHGRMVEITPDYECPWFTVWECNLCGNRGENWYNYCPNCGADMRAGG